MSYITGCLIGFFIGYLFAQNIYRKREIKALQEKMDFLTLALNKREKPREEIIVNKHFPS